MSVVKRICGMDVAAAAVTLVCVLVLSATAPGAAATPFREVARMEGAADAVQSDGVRFAWATDWFPPIDKGREWSGSVRVFDTLRGRNFRLTAPALGCDFVWIGGGLALWSCDPPTLPERLRAAMRPFVARTTGG